MLNVVLYQPEIPPNTGNIVRQCVGMNARLHLVGPLSMDLSARAVRRAGLDYWDEVMLHVYQSPRDFLAWLGSREPWLVTKYGRLRYDRPEYGPEDILLFGSETRGLPRDWLTRWPERAVHVPLLGKVRSYNLANTVSIVLAQASLKAGIFEV